MPRTAIYDAVNLGFKDHKLSVVENSSDEETLQIIAAGLPRCGTTSLKAALEILGFDPCHHMVVSVCHN